MIYSIDEIREKVAPIAQKYEVKKIFIFGSYARGEATENSDIDILFYSKGTKAKGLKTFGFELELQDALGKKVEVFPKEDFESEMYIKHNAKFIDNVLGDEVLLYEQAA
ncbi:MAG: nucleotidyltransferase domain-containing protein [Lactobacillales bacterium]|jgi:predicted nucleotidyltransferase|nr:nucleotidyltransferase domain-containing protein [Lactobacillales bacterium]